jgi:hypothetical protein
MIPIYNVQQNTEEWFKLRVGRPSASNFDKIITSQGKPSKQRDAYLYQLAGEIITGQKEDTYQSYDMKVGIEREGEARNLYEMLYDVDVQQVGLCYLDEKMEVSCSPDGLVNEDGLVEIKCVKLSTQVQYLLENRLPPTYTCQCQGQLFVTDRKWLDFVSYYPAMPPLVVRVYPDRKVIDPLREELKSFVKELKEVVNKLKEN